jgi:hypothetical protein
MGLLDRFFGHGKDADAPAGAASTQFRESEPDTEESRVSRNAPRRELVQVVLRDTMRKHGIPSDWVECRILSTINRSGRPGLHVNFVVKKAHDKLLAYVFAFQDSFEREIARFDPRARDWLMSLGWEFQGFNAADMPDPHTWMHSGVVPLQAPLVQPDWRGPSSGFGHTVPPDEDSRPADEDVQRDIQALFAIRDAAMGDTPRQPPADPRRNPAPDAPDFENTHPGEDPGPRRF